MRQLNYKVNFILTDKTEVTQEEVFNKSFAVIYSNDWHIIEEVKNDKYVLSNYNSTDYYKRIPKTYFSKIYKPVIELEDESINQLLETEEFNLYADI